MGNPSLFTRVINSFSNNKNDAPLTGAYTPVNNIPLEIIGTTPLNLYGYNIINPNTVDIFVKFYNQAASPVAGVDYPKLIIQVPANGTVVLSGTDIIAGFDINMWTAATLGYLFSDNTALPIACIVQLTVNVI